MRVEVGKVRVIGKKAPPITLPAHTGKTFELSNELKDSHIMLAFYPGGAFKPVCLKQFCDYDENKDQFDKFNLKIVGVSKDSVDKQNQFAQNNQYPFTFLSDHHNKVARSYGCNTLFMLNGPSRALFIIHSSGTILFRYVEPTILTRRGSKEVLKVLGELRENSLI